MDLKSLKESELSSPVTSEETLEYVPNQIIVKFKQNAARQVEAELMAGTPADEILISDSIDSLNERYSLQGITPLFPNSKKNLEKLEQIKTKDQKKLTKKEKHILKRSKRAPKDAKVPKLDRIYLLELELGKDQSLEDAVAEFKADKGIQYAELNHTLSLCQVPNDPEYSLQWALNSAGLNSVTGEHDIDAPEAWDITTGDSDVIVAVVDSGVDYNHPDLAGNIWVNSVELNGKRGLDDDGNGCIDDIYGYDFGVGDSYPLDESGHGTHCAGIIGAKGDNDLNVTGVGWNTTIMSLKCGGGSSVSRSATFQSISYATDEGADVISCSLGQNGAGDFWQTIIDYAYSQGVIVVAAAGNDNENIPFYPAACDHVIAVAATDQNDNKASFSNYGEWVDIAAPGVSILSLKPGASTAYMQGTSMACPHVSGACAILLSVMPELTVDEVTQILMDTGDPIADGICFSDGRLNLFNAIVAALPEAGKVVLDSDFYSFSDIINISLYDTHLFGNGAVTVTLSTSGGDSETLTLNEPRSSGAFFGNILTSDQTVSIEDGMIQTSDGETITVTYQDADDGTGNPATVTDTAIADCTAPVITSHQIEVPGPNPTVTIESNEQVTTIVHCGTQAGGPYEIVTESVFSNLTHHIKLSGVLSSTTYYYIVEMTDAAGNITIDDNGGQDHSFITTAPGDVFVPSDANTIQKAIDYCWDGGTVWIADGTYTGLGNRDISWFDKSITVQSLNGPGNCIIDCEGTEQYPSRAFYFSGLEEFDYKISGLTITNGYSSEYGGGIVFFCPGKITIENCVFANNQATQEGGALCLFNDGWGNFSYTQAVITNCTFSVNSADEGGAIYNRFFMEVAINDCDFLSNTAVLGGGVFNDGSHFLPKSDIYNCSFVGNDATSRGGGIYTDSQVKDTYSNCIFQGNDAYADGGAIYRYSAERGVFADCSFIGNSSEEGGGIYDYHNSIDVVKCLFKENQAINRGYNPYKARGAGIYAVRENNNTVVESCLFANNVSEWQGGGICSNQGDLTINGCTFNGNLAPEGNTMYCGYPNGSSNFVKAYSSIIWDGLNSIVINSDIPEEIRHCDIQGGYAGEGNINSEPLFVDPNNGGFGLTKDSPCINTGQPDFEYTGQKDLAGSPRVIFDRVDMGAYELSGIYNQNRQIFYDTIQLAIDDAVNGETIILGPGTYTGNGNRDLTLNGKAITLQSINPEDPNIVEATIIDCEGSSSENHYAIKFDNVECTTVLDGITITGGHVSSASGHPTDGVLYLIQSSPIIQNCVFTGNTTTIIYTTSNYYGQEDIIIDNCHFYDNTAMCIKANADISIMSCLFEDNAVSYEFVRTEACVIGPQTKNIKMQHCIFKHNQYPYGCLKLNSGDAQITNSEFIENQYSHEWGAQGAAIYYDDSYGVSHNIEVNGCVFYGNTVEVPGVPQYTTSKGAAMYLSGCLDDKIEISNCSFYGNEADEGSSIYLRTFSSFDPNDGFSLAIKNSIIWDGIDSFVHQDIPGLDIEITYTDIYGGYTGNGNIDIDPNFVDAVNGNLRLQFGSPCIDTGDPNQSYDGQYDLDSSKRLLGSNVDMGAYEYKGVLNVNTQIWYPTIQSAVNAAATNDVIELYPGTYTGTGNRDIDFGGKAITARSTDPSDSSVIESTIVDCQATDSDRHRGFYFHSGEGAGSILDGITIINAMAPYDPAGYYPGSAIFCDNGSSPTIRNCVTKNNTDQNDYSDGVIVCYNNSDALIENCTMTNNSSAFSVLGAWASSPTIRDCVISDNTDTWAPVSFYETPGGSIEDCSIENNNCPDGYGSISVFYSTVTVENCTVTNNTNTTGGGLYLDSSSGSIIRNSLIADNTAASNGGGICSYFTDLSVENCTISNNTAGSYGGGVNILGGVLDFDNSIFWGNTAPTGSQINKSTGTATYSYCDIQDSGGSASWDTALGTDGGGNIDADPLFDTDGYHINLNSPCINTGNPSVVYDGQNDVDGEPRVMGGQVDMGVDEFNGICNINTDVWYSTISAAVADESTSAVETIEVGPGIYYDNIDNTAAENDMVITSVDPDDMDLVAATIIDGGGSGTVVTFNSGETTSSVLEGFTITGGNATNGGGIHISNNSGPTVQKCIIEDNDATNGAGIFAIANSGAPVGTRAFSNCIIRNNDAITNGGGLKLGTYGGAYKINNCMIINNTAANGGGVYRDDYCGVVVTNCTIAGNTATSGGGVYGTGYGSIVIKNSILWDNTGGQITSTGYTSVTYSDVQGGYTGAINSDPLFADGPLGDYYLSQIAAGQGSDSPCVDSGSDTAVNLGLDTVTTRTDEVTDANTVDMGYHYSD